MSIYHINTETVASTKLGSVRLTDVLQKRGKYLIFSSHCILLEVIVQVRHLNSSYVDIHWVRFKSEDDIPQRFPTPIITLGLTETFAFC